MIRSVNIIINDRTYLKDPMSSELGRKIISHSIEMIHELGFDEFTFRKLGQRINSPEASVYRYFESKHKLLLYLTSWYWAWMEYRIVFATVNVESPIERLNRVIDLITQRIQNDENFSHIDEVKLQMIVTSESSKAYLTKQVDAENKEGMFSAYKELVRRVSGIILEVNPNYPYPHMLTSSLIESIHHQRFFADHLPRLTNVIQGEDAVRSFCKDLIYHTVINTSTNGK
jgi:AcrR family transcriptional regulator